jgi:hypothetical protein
MDCGSDTALSIPRHSPNSRRPKDDYNMEPLKIIRDWAEQG